MEDAELPNETLEEISREERQRRHQLKADAEVFQTLVKHPGWARYMALCEVAGNNFNKTLMQPLENSLQVVKTEFAKGALYGIQGVASLPHAKIKEAADLGLLKD